MTAERGNSQTSLVGLTVGMLILGALFAVSCSPNNPLSVVPDPNSLDCKTINLTYENFGAPFFETYCLRCHSETLTNDFARTDAPIGINFNTLSVAKEFKNRIYLRAGELGDMPPHIVAGPKPSEDERLQLMQWIDCGMKSESD